MPTARTPRATSSWAASSVRCVKSRWNSGFYQRLADHSLEPHIAQSRAVGEEVVRRVDVRARVAPQGEEREVARVALRDAPHGLDLEDRVAWVDVHAARVRDGDVDHAPARGEACVGNRD